MVNPNTGNDVAAEYETRFAELRAQLAEAQGQVAAMREAMTMAREAIESYPEVEYWDSSQGCHVCKAEATDAGVTDLGTPQAKQHWNTTHTPDCPRQLALAKLALLGATGGKGE